jgi:bacteriocin-like protein
MNSIDTTNATLSTLSEDELTQVVGGNKGYYASQPKQKKPAVKQIKQAHPYAKKPAKHYGY